MSERIPILEYDPDPRAVLEPGHECLELELPPRAAMPLVGEFVDRYAREKGLEVLGEFSTVSKRCPVYKVSEDVCLCEGPMGAPMAAALADWLIAHGVREIVAAGACGALVDLPENAFVVPRRALRDEGTSYHYMQAARWIELDRPMWERIEAALEHRGIPFVNLDTWTTDALFRETRGKIRQRRSEGCGVVEMECAALAAVARFRGADFGQLLYTADTLADTDAYDERDWGRDSLMPALELCLEALSKATE